MASGNAPILTGLHPSVAAEVLLRVGVLTGWIGSKTQTKEAQETAKNLITESITYFESIGDHKQIAAARVELAYCYWRDGELNEARIMLRESLEKLTTEGPTRARALLKLITVENSAARYTESLRLLTDNTSLFQKIQQPHRLRAITITSWRSRCGSCHGRETRRLLLRKRSTNTRPPIIISDLLAIRRLRASVKNNVGFLLLNLSRFKEAHKYLDEARRSTVSFRDKPKTAQIDLTRAQVLIAEGKRKEAEAVAQRAAVVFRKKRPSMLVGRRFDHSGNRPCASGQNQRAHFIFQKAIEIAHTRLMC